jgi:hypothetical protein
MMACSFPEFGRRRFTLAVLGTALVVLVGGSAFAGTPSAELGKQGSNTTEALKADPPTFPLKGSLTLDNSLGMGTFSEGAGELSRPYFNMLLSVKAHYRVPIELKLTVGLRFDVDINLIENVDSSNTQPNQLQVGDLRLWTQFKDILKHAPAGLSLSGGVELFLPTSLMSQYATKWLGIRTNLSLTWSKLSWLEFTYGLSATKNFNGYTTNAVDWDDFDTPRISRPGGAENIAEGLTATGAGIVEWGVSNSLSGTVTFLKDFSVSLEFALVNTFTYDTGAADAYTSSYARAGRAQRDITYGSLDFSWNALKHLSVSVGSVVAQEPKTSDNTGFRFPFWDMTNGASNRQILYLSLKGAM